ncbi:MAG: hypothetical protein IJA85_10365 [Clostridia bacterium]|nr:hypothetical protein [Clostridia bacterium]
MTDWKKTAKRILSPPPWLTLLLVVFSTAALIAVFVKEWQEAPIAYAVYVTAFYTLCVLCMLGAKRIPGWYRSGKNLVYSNKFGNRYMTDAAFKTRVSLYRSLAINLLYVLINLVSGRINRSAWFYILAGYYGILAVMRFLLLRYQQRKGIGSDLVGEYRRSRLCGMILMMINFTLTGAVLMMLYQNRGYDYPGILIYVMAMYTFYITAQSIAGLLRSRKYHSPIMSSAKIISLSAALVSMLSLETAMLTQFGAENSPEFRQIMIAATGAGVSIVVVTMSVYMILRAGKEIKKLQNK